MGHVSPVKFLEYLYIDNSRNLPNHDDGEVENVPRVFEVGVGVRDESVRNYLHAAFAREDHREDHFYRFLRFWCVKLSVIRSLAQIISK